MTPTPPCPDCQGPHLEGWRWQHVPRRPCPIRAADDATQAADAERATPRGMVRAATPAEARLWTLVTGTPLPAQAVTVVHAGGYWAREVNGYRSAADAVAAHITDPEGTAA